MSKLKSKNIKNQMNIKESDDYIKKNSSNKINLNKRKTDNENDNNDLNEENIYSLNYNYL